MEMRIAILVPNLTENAPYLSCYTDVFQANNISYDIVCWDRNKRLSNTESLSENLFIFDKAGLESNGPVRKIFDYIRFIKFVKTRLNCANYDLVITANIALAFFLCRTLIIKYKRKYILDIRDYSIICKIFPRVILILIKHAALNVVSSIGYLNWLPKEQNYTISHNVRKISLTSNLFQYEMKDEFLFNKPIEILTIGQIRDFDSNSLLIDKLGRLSTFKLKFCGEGLDSLRLQSYAKKYSTNCLFTGVYKKIEEENLVVNCDFLNIILPEKKEVMTQMTNRFYLGLIYGKPIIVNSKSIQSEFVRKYKLGLVINFDDDFEKSIIRYIEEFDQEQFNLGIKNLMAIVNAEIDFFEQNVLNILKK